MTITSLILLWFFILGTVIGSFLNVVIYRFNTGKSLSGRSHCLSCGTRLSWYELVPVFSYLVQRGSCRSCRARITPRYLVVELLTGLLFFLTAQVFFYDPILLLLNLGIASVLIVITVYDLRHTIIPDRLVVYLSVLALVYVLCNPTQWTVSILFGGLIPAVFFGGLWLVSRGRWIGLGDAKLAVPLGLIIIMHRGVIGSISMLILGFWIGAIVSVSVLAFQKIQRGQHRLPFARRHLTMKSEVPFAPFLICAFFLVQFWGVDVFALIEGVFR